MSRTKTVPVSIKTKDDGLEDGEFIVYPSTFTRTPDSYGDVVAVGAFDDTIKEWKESGNVLPGLYGHRMDDPDFNIASAIDMGVDEHGWWVRGKFDMDEPKAAKVYRLVKAKRISQLSFAYDVFDEGTIELEDGTKANELRKLKVYEFSFVPVGANQDTSVVEVKSVGATNEGRFFSDQNITDLKSLIASFDGVSTDLKNFLSQAEGGEGSEKASGQAEAKSEEPVRVKDEEPGVNPSVNDLSPIEITMLDLYSGGKDS